MNDPESVNGEGVLPQWGHSALSGLDGGSMVVFTLIVIDLCI